MEDPDGLRECGGRLRWEGAPAVQTVTPPSLGKALTKEGLPVLHQRQAHSPLHQTLVGGTL